MQLPLPAGKPGIRPLCEAEIPAAAALVWQVFTQFEAPDYAPEGIAAFRRFIAPETLAAQFRSGALQLWGAFGPDSLVGVAATRDRNHICLLFVERSFHRQGIARSLFDCIRNRCHTDTSITRITVNSSPYAVEAYRRLGFAATDTELTANGIRFTPMEYIL